MNDALLATKPADAANDNGRPLHPAVAAYLAEIDARIAAERAARWGHDD